MTVAPELSASELEDLELFLSQVQGGKIPNTDALDGFFAALACCPDLVKPSEYLPVVHSGKTEEGDLVFEDVDEAQRFMGLVNQHWNYVNYQLNKCEVYLPLIIEDDKREYAGEDWANGFLCGIDMRRGIWSELINSEEHGGSIVPIMALAYENHPDSEMRPFKEPMDEKKREELIIGAAAGVMRMHAHFLGQRNSYLPDIKTVIRPHRKIGRNEPCPCGSGKKYKRCCGSGPTLH